MGPLGGVQGVYQAKKELFDYLATQIETDAIAVNLDDPRVCQAFEECFRGRNVRRLSFSTSRKADVRVTTQGIDPQTAFTRISVEAGSLSLRTSIPVFGEHHAMNLAASIAMAKLAGVDDKAIRDRIEEIRPAAHRGEIRRIRCGALLIDDCYNSNPKALLSSLESLFRLPTRHRLVLVLGEMRELGPHTAQEHERVAIQIQSWIQKRGGQVIVLGVGTAMIQALTHIQTDSYGCKSVNEAIDITRGILTSSDIVFVKGSRAVQLDQLVTTLCDTYPAKGRTAS
jgi:UDP-N-acetylmuramoyl-tripeptide--D-alanyl-D-alanine ligase